tara:strand:+ start:1750 stop:1923 length:174 start_codon:yes stop_codon:yes gene_type:complete
MYKKYKDYNNNIIESSIIKIEDGSTIPFDPANTDYQEYLQWIEEGNTPEPADEVDNG